MFHRFLSGGIQFNPDTDIPDLTGKVIFITGGNLGIGLQTALSLAKHNPSHIYISARNKTTAESAIATIRSAVPSANVTFLPCDLTDLSRVTACARDFINREKRLDMLFLNAGIMAAPAATTAQGYEIQFGTNHVGHFLLTRLLLPTLEQTAKLPDTDVRVITVSSMGHTLAPGPGIVFSELRTDMNNWLTIRRYGQSKLANILFARHLAKQLKANGSEVLAVSLHPGVVNTTLYGNVDKWPIVGPIMKIVRNLNFFFIDSKEGAKTQLWAATAERAINGSEATLDSNMGKVVNGEYYTPIAVAGQGSKISQQEDLAQKLWDWTEEEVKNYVL